jgi:hypothetical protein
LHSFAIYSATAKDIWKGGLKGRATRSKPVDQSVLYRVNYDPCQIEHVEIGFRLGAVVMNRRLLQLKYDAACLATDVTKPHTVISNSFCLSRVLNRIQLELMYQTAPQHATYLEAGTVGRKKA